jgi:hypothetical protein
MTARKICRKQCSRRIVLSQCGRAYAFDLFAFTASAVIGSERSLIVSITELAQTLFH